MSSETVRQITSTAGLGLLFAALGMSVVHGLLSPLGVVVACVPLLAAGVAIAAVARWPVLAAGALAAAIATLIAVTAQGASGAAVALGAVGTVAAGAALSASRRWSWHMVAALAGGAALLLSLTFAGATSPWQVLASVAAQWLLAAVVSVVHAARGRSADAARVAVAGTLAAIAVGSGSVAWCAQALVVAGALIAVHGLALDRAARRATVAGRGLGIAGITLAGLSSTLWIGAPGVALATAALGLLLFASGERLHLRKLVIAGLIVEPLAAIVMAACHPAWSGAAPTGWHVWSGVALALALALGWTWSRCRGRGANAASLPAWVAEASKAAAGLAALASISTELGLIAGAGPALNVLWLAASAALWLPGRRSAGLRGLSLAAAVAAAFKLALFDWVALEGTTRVVLVFVTGATLLVAPLFFAGGPARRARATEAPAER
jgi:hypothetical protein